MGFLKGRIANVGGMPPHVSVVLVGWPPLLAGWVSLECGGVLLGNPSGLGYPRMLDYPSGMGRPIGQVILASWGYPSPG